MSIFGSSPSVYHKMINLIGRGSIRGQLRDFVDVEMVNPVSRDYLVTCRGEIDQPHIIGGSVVVEAELTNN